LAREEVRRDLGLLVVRQLDAVEVRGGRHPPPARVAARPGRVVVADVDGTELHQIPATLRRVLALTGADRDSAGQADVAHVARVVRPDAGLLEPADVEVADAPAQVEGLHTRVSLARVDGQDEVVAARLARGLDAFRILGR